MHSSRMSTRVVLSALVVLIAAPAFAAPGSDSAYVTDQQMSRVEDATSRGIGEVNMIACIMSAMRPDALVNEPSYIALIDKDKCDEKERSSSSNADASEGAQGAASYITATVTPTRASNTEPMITKAWLELDEEGAKVLISVRISATEAPSASNPYGAFRFDYCGQFEGAGPCLMGGFIEAADGGINYYDSTSGDEEQSTAMNLAVTSTGGAGKLEIHGDGGGDATFAFAYDGTLYHRDIDGDTQCFSRDASDPDTGFSVWRYGVYDAATGERITRNSGFPIQFDADGTTYHGFLGYYGLSVAPEAQNLLVNDSVVSKVDYPVGGGDPVRTDYRVMKAGGKLTKFTKRATTLDKLDQIHFTTYVGIQEANDFFAGATPNTSYELYWDEATDSFIVSAEMACNQNGCQTTALNPTKTVLPAYWALRGGLQGYAQLLGGELFIDMNGVSSSIDSTLVTAVYRTQDLVYPADLPAGLHCLQNCPTAATLQAYFDSNSSDPSATPYISATNGNWLPTAAADVITYGASEETASLTGGDGTSADVVYTNGEGYEQHPQYPNGIMSGRLFANLDDALCDPNDMNAGYCEYRVSNAEVYYQWQTGPNNWNQFAAVKDDAGEFVEFQAPLQLNYHVPDETRYGQYANTNIVMQYGGFGDLWGIPGTCVSASTNETVPCANSPDTRYVPAFVIPYDATLGVVTSTDDDTPYLVKWLEREIRFARKTGGQCSALSLPTEVDLPTAALVQNPADPASAIYIGPKPEVTDAPRVIHGEVKY